MVFELDFRSANVSGAVVPGQLRRGRIDQLQRAREIVFLVHGFNLDRAEGRIAMDNLARKLPRMRDAALVSVLWAGDHWSGAISYSFEGRDADDTGFYLARFISDHLHRNTKISFATHSLGARVALEAINRVGRLGYFADQVCMMAAAVDDYSLAVPNGYKAAMQRCNRVTVLASRKDSVLKYAYPAGDLLQSFVFWRDEDFGSALGYHGPRARRQYAVPRNVAHTQIRDARNAGHGDYIPDSPPTQNQESATSFCDQVLSGERLPLYR
ncbi:MAG: alpha/beta hydrolase [Bacteroidota bacterium]